MPKSDKKYPYLDEDFLFLMLKLADFPHGKNDTTSFHELRNLEFKNSTGSEIILSLLDLEEEFGGLTFDKYYIDLLRPKNVGKIIERGTDAGIYIFEKFAYQDTDKLKTKLARREFDMKDLEYIAMIASEDSENLIAIIDFNIKISDTFKIKARKDFKEYVDYFEHGKLILENKKINYYTIENHVLHGFEIINKIREDSGNEVALNDFIFGEKFHFLEFMLFLHFSKYLKITDIDAKDAAFAIEATISKKLINKAKTIPKKNTRLVHFPLPTGTAWDDMTLKFINKFDLQVFVKDKLIGIINNEQLDCFKKNSKSYQCDEQWNLLTNIAIENGVLDLNKFSVFNHFEYLKKKEKIKKQRQKLAERLRIVFKISADPFRQLPQPGIFKTAFKLVPCPELRSLL